MNVSERGLKFIAGFEDFSPFLYNDAAGHATIGIGHLVHLGKINGTEKPEYKAGITLTRAYEILRKDAGYAEHAVNNQLCPLILKQEQFDALVSFVFNEGAGTFIKSSVCSNLNSGRLDLIPEALKKYVYAGGKLLPGLVTRRATEALAFV